MAVYRYMLSLGVMEKGDYICLNQDLHSAYECFDTEVLMREHWLELVLQGFTLLYSYQCPSLEGQLPKQLTNQQTSAIPVNPNNTSGGQYTQNYP